MNARRYLALAVLIGTLIAGVVGFHTLDLHPERHQHPTPVAGGSASAITGLLARLHVTAALPNPAGYDRACTSGHACTFGPAWTDATSAPDGHNGCGTRDDVLRRDLTTPTIKPGTHNCVVLTGTLHDPYTGKTISFTRGPESSSTVQIDHMVALKRGYDLGANTWPLARREQFANDPANLTAVAGVANTAKGDHGLEWLPPAVAYRCTYVTRYLTVLDSYQLPITKADVAVAQTTAAHDC